MDEECKELWGQVRGLQNDVAVIKTRQDIALERVKEFVETYESDKSCTDSTLKECRDMLQEILTTQKAYNKIVSKAIPFAVVVFTAIVSLVTSIVMKGLNVK